MRGLRRRQPALQESLERRRIGGNRRACVLEPLLQRRVLLGGGGNALQKGAVNLCRLPVLATPLQQRRLLQQREVEVRVQLQSLFQGGRLRFGVSLGPSRQCHMEPQQRRPRIQVHRLLEAPPGRGELTRLEGQHPQGVQDLGASRSCRLGRGQQAGSFGVLTGRGGFVGGVDHGANACVIRCYGAHSISRAVCVDGRQNMPTTGSCKNPAGPGTPKKKGGPGARLRQIASSPRL